MSLSVTTNVASQNAQRHASAQGAGLTRSIQRLSSGLRINSAADDAAGLAIADRMTSGLRGMSQAGRNINDATSLMQVADGGMAQITESLQRLRELAVQAGNGAYSDSDRASLQLEATQILSHITQIGKETSFNGEAVFSQSQASIGGDEKKRAVIDGLKNGWLRSAEKLVQQYYGLTGDGATLTVNLEGGDGPFNVLASVSGTVGGGSSKFNNMHLNIDMDDFDNTNPPDGGRNPMFSDRIIAHEMTHAIMTRATGFALPKWFVEGTAELIHGADERLAGAVAGGNEAAVVNTLSSGFSYESAYAASRYLHYKLNEMHVDGGIKGIMLYLHDHQNEGLNEALNAVTNGVYANVAAFEADFTANGVDYISNHMNLANADTGAIGGLDADGGPVRNARDVVPDVTDRPSDDPMEGLKVVFPTLGGSAGSRQVQVQVGATAKDNFIIDLGAMNAAALGIDKLKLATSGSAITHIDEALEYVAKQRTNVGASMKRLESASSSLQVNTENLAASRSRILDADYAAETATLTRSQILQQAATSMVAQANSLPNSVLALLR
ncbi:MAG: flagellinolysin [Massilia sp.]